MPSRAGSEQDENDRPEPGRRGRAGVCLESGRAAAEGHLAGATTVDQYKEKRRLLAARGVSKLADFVRFCENVNEEVQRMPSLGLNLPALFPIPRSGRCFRVLQAAYLS